MRQGRLTVFLCGMVCAAGLVEGAAWPSFLHDGGNTGRSPHTVFSRPGLLWSQATGAVVAAAPIISDGGVAYFGSYDGTLLAVNQEGDVLWRFAATAEIDSTPAVLPDGTVVFGALDGKLYALDAGGGLLWTYSTDSAIRRSSPAVTSGGAIAIGTLDGRLLVLEPSGDLRFEAALGGPSWSTPGLGGDMICIGSDGGPGGAGGAVSAFSLDSGTPLWRYETTAHVRSAIMVRPDGVFFVTVAGTLIALHLDGTPRWTMDLGAAAPYTSAAAGSNSELYVGAADGFHAVTADGTPLWSWTDGIACRGAPAVDASGIVMTGAEDGRLYAFHPDGRIAWWFATGDLIASAPAIGEDGRVLVGSFDSRLYALVSATPTPSPTATATPTPTPSPTPFEPPPLILAAGYLDSHISTAAGGSFSMVAWVVDPDGDGVRSVEVLFNGDPVAELPASRYADVYMYENIPVPPGLLDGEYHLQLRAADFAGAVSDTWPGLTIHTAETATAGVDTSGVHGFMRILQGFRQAAGTAADPAVKPCIYAAGFMDTWLREHSSSRVTVTAFAEPGANGSTMQLYHQRQATGVMLVDDGGHGDFAAADGIFGFTTEGAIETGLAGTYDFQIAMTSGSGERSHFWPYLVVTRE
ncbi:PQQ-like beta-propeller repeat protein [bacterium]|nr:PQQ-like beta-propeller repeat protein [candidate division CSSED10-310 bacterium]